MGNHRRLQDPLLLIVVVLLQAGALSRKLVIGNGPNYVGKATSILSLPVISAF